VKPWEELLRWPLLAVGLVIVGLSVGLAQADDPSDTRALLLGLGCVLCGAGIVLVVLGKKDQP
jgi:hypothetical protein